MESIVRRTTGGQEFGHEIDQKEAKKNLLKDIALYYALAQSGLIYAGSQDGMNLVAGNRQLLKELKEESPEGMRVYRQIDKLPNQAVKGLLINLYDRRTSTKSG